jgi:ketosteroid isomerase-like protein
VSDVALHVVGPHFRILSHHGPLKSRAARKEHKDMGAVENKQLIHQIFDELSKGNSELFVASMADDFRWTVTGATKWSKTYEGKQSVLAELFGPLRARINGRIKTTAHRLIAEGDYVVVEARGSNITKSGLPYNNNYCFVFRLSANQLKEVTEYLDTELVTAALGFTDT